MRDVGVIYRGLLRSVLMVWLCVGVAVAESSSELLDDARAYLEKGDLKSAEIQLKNALQKDPSLVEARLLLGRVHLQSGRMPEAQKEFERASQLGAPASEWMLALGKTLLAQREYGKVLEQVTAATLVGSVADQADAYSLRGAAHLGLRQVEEARTAFEQALQLAPDELNARIGLVKLTLLDGDADTALQSLNEIVQSHPDNAEAWLIRGEVFRQRREFEQARASFEKSIELAPRNVRASIAHAVTSLALRDADAALEDVARIRKYAPKLPVAGYLHGLAAFFKRDFVTASDQLQAVIQTAPGHLQTQLLLGLTKYAQEEFQRADDYLSLAASRMPGNIEIAKAQGAARLKLKQAKRALEVLAPAAEARPEDPQLLALLGNAHMLAGDNAKGAEYLARAVELDPDQAALRTQLAISRLASGETDAAVSELETAVDLGSDLMQTDLLLVLSYINKGQTDKALKAAADLESRMPDSPIPYNLSGLSLLAAKDLDAAERKFVRALEVDPSFLVAEMNRARLDLIRKDMDAARAHYEAVLEKSDKHLGAMLALAGIARRQGDDAAALRWVEKAHASNPTALPPTLLLAERYLRERQPLKTLNLLGNLTGPSATNAAVLRLKGMAQVMSGDAVNAITTLERLTQTRPESVEAWFQLGRAQHQAGRQSAALASFERARDLDTAHRFPLASAGLIELLILDKAYDRAALAAGRMQQQFPDNALGYDLEATVLAAQGDPAAAIKRMSRAIELQPSAPRARKLAALYAATGDMGGAEKALRDWLNRSPQDGTGWSALATLLHRNGDVAAALTAYERAAELRPDDAVLLNNVAWLYHQNKDPRARDLARKAYELSPNTPEILDTYGWILFHGGDRKKGLNHLQEALVIAPRNAEISLHVAAAMQQMGRDAEAKPILLRVLKDFPNTPHEAEARQLLSRLRN